MSWNGIITDVGASAIAYCIANNVTMNVNDVKIGTGTRSEAAMYTATGLVTQVGSGSITKKKITDNTVEIRIGIGPGSTEKRIKEIGIFGTYNSNNVLIALYQNEEGIVVPASSAFPDYGYMMNVVWKLDNTNALTVTVDSAAYVTTSALAEEMNTLIVDEFDPTQAYQQGNLAIHDGALFERTTDYAIAEAWDPEKWTQRTINDITPIMRVSASIGAGVTKIISVPCAGPFLLLFYDYNQSRPDTLGLYIGYARSSASSIKAILASDMVSSISISGKEISVTTPSTKSGAYCLLPVRNP